MEKTEIITIRGIVQGVGFRPTVYRLALELGIKGQVRNEGGVVRIIVTDEPVAISDFIEVIRQRKPPMSRIDSVERVASSLVPFTMFSIEQSRRDEGEIANIPADIAICSDCLKEFRDRQNVRYRHPFISCANCGPRFTIMETLPYDRESTTMNDYEMCEVCGGEYMNPADRRYHAQTVSCHDCGPIPIWKPATVDKIVGIADMDQVAFAIDAIKSGGVIALKGVGGYYLVCSPYSESAVMRLREIKQREQKPFAVMFGSVPAVREHCKVSEEEAELLSSPERPIVLVERIETYDSLAPSVSSGSRRVGALLPSMGIQHILTDEIGPLVMTSANITGFPIVSSDDDMEMLVQKSGMLVGMLYNTRRITSPMDDSVLCVVAGQQQMIRRAKGYVPSAIMLQAGSCEETIQVFAAGAHLKSVFSLSRGGAVYLSQHFGDLDSLESEQMYIDAFHRMESFFNISPSIVAYDMHPNYLPTRFAKSFIEGAVGDLSDVSNIQGLPIQHHHAHIASVMAEHGIATPVIGIAFDGTGYGTDGKIWGGEVLICKGTKFERFSHLRYVKFVGGDAGVREGWKSAIAYKLANEMRCTPQETLEQGRVFDIDLTEIIAYAERHETLKGAFDELDNETPISGRTADDIVSANERINDTISAVKTAVCSGIGMVESSSMGRLFDAVASLLGIHHVNRYEGECAIMLENAAHRAVQGSETPADQLALNFHRSVASRILSECIMARRAYAVDKVCLSGGVFQNTLLLEETERLLAGENFIVYRNIIVPPNDGGIALGQNYLAMLTAIKTPLTSDSLPDGKIV